MKIEVTKKFVESMGNSGAPDLIALAVWKLERFLTQKHTTNTALTWSKNTKPIEGSSLSLLEHRIDDKGRIIFSFERGRLLLIDCALTHTAVEAFVKQSRQVQDHIIATKAPTPRLLSARTSAEKAALALDSEGTPAVYEQETYIEEHFHEWVHFLDERQVEARDKILKHVFSHEGHFVHLVLGGAGTGKTVVLTNLAFALDELGQHEIELKVNSGVREYLKAGEREIPGLSRSNLTDAVRIQRLAERNRKLILLVDDPVSLDSLLTSVARAKLHNCPIVISLDPIQWFQRRVSEGWEQFLQTTEYEMYPLTQNYRQRKKTGEQAIAVIKGFLDKSSPFMDSDKVTSERNRLKDVREVCLENVTFVGETGGFRVVEGDLESALSEELDLVRKDPSEIKWPKLLYSAKHEWSIPPNLKDILDDFSKESFARFREINKVNDIRGTEYNTVFLFVYHQEWRKLVKGVMGAGKDDWQDLNRVLLLLTRAKNRYVVFLTNSEFPDLLANIAKKTVVRG